VLDLACGDGNVAEPLLALGLRYRGVDGSAAMVEEARARLGDRVPFDLGLLDEYEPPEPVDMTICLRTVYSLPDPRPVFRRVAGYTRRKLVFDFDPRATERDGVLRALRESGFGGVELRPFLLPQSVRLAAPARGAVLALERTGPLARAALRVRGIWFCAATPLADWRA
jgi:SAM-dependent methyltransferase